VERLTVSTVVYRPREEVFDFLCDFSRYADYSKHLRAVERDGDGTTGTHYRLTFGWWKLSYVAHTEVTAVEEPARIEWAVTRHIDAQGEWRVEPADPPAGREHATRVTLAVQYTPGSVDGGAIDVPALVSLDWVVERAAGLIREEGERVVERVVADLEGESRPVELDVTVSG
jgi:uncharacterized membrane protein